MGHMAAHMLSLCLSVSRISQVSLKKKKEKKNKTPYDWQKHPHAHIKMTVKVILKTVPLVINNLA